MRASATASASRAAKAWSSPVAGSPTSRATASCSRAAPATIQSCDTAETGYSGISYLGGDRHTLTPGGHRIINNIVARTGLFYPAPGINGGLATRAEAVGNLIAHNRIHDA